MNALQFMSPATERQPVLPMPNATAPAPAPARPSANPLTAIQPSQMRVQPKAANPNPLATAFGRFARAFAPEQTAAVDERYKTEKAEKAKRALVWMKQTAALPADQRAAFTLSRAQDIANDTGQPYEAVVASARDPNGFSDQALNGAIAEFSALAGLAPEDPTYMNLGGGAVGKVAGGNFSVVRDAPMAPAKPTVVNGRVLDPNDPTKVLADYSDPQKSAVDWKTEIIGNRVVAYNPQDPTQTRDMGPAPAKGGGDNGNKPLSDYQALQFQFKLDDLDRELEDKEKKRKGDLSTVDASINLLSDFLDENDPKKKTRFDEVYGNWINPTGEGNDLFNPRVQPGSDRANGMAILEQIGGRAFLDSIAAMRGTGPLSDREGARVTAAATRLTQVTQSDDAAREAGKEFMSALKAYKTALEQDIANSRRAEASRRQQMQAMMGRQPQGQDADIEAILNEALGPDEMDAPDGVDPEDWKHLTPEEQQQYLAGTQ